MQISTTLATRSMPSQRRLALPLPEKTANPKPIPRFGNQELAGHIVVWGGLAILGVAWLCGTIKDAVNARLPAPGADHPEVREAFVLAEEAKMREAEASRRANDAFGVTPPSGL